MSELLETSVPAALSDIGCERELNEDRYAIIECQSGTAYIVCDGMGGEAGGDLAAQLAIDAMRRVLENSADTSAEQVVSAAVNEANRVIVLRRQNQLFSNMGTTIAVAFRKGNQWLFGHAGDSRIYLVRGNSISQLTVDHTYVQDLVNKGEITLAEAMNHPQAHVLTRCLGYEPTLSLDKKKLWRWDSEESDKLVICSDGLYSLISDQEIMQAVNSCASQEACVELVEMAKARGGFDNITIAVVPVGGKLTEEENKTILDGVKSGGLSAAGLRERAKPLITNAVAVCASAMGGMLIGSVLLLYMLSKA